MATSDQEEYRPSRTASDDSQAAEPAARDKADFEDEKEEFEDDDQPQWAARATGYRMEGHIKDRLDELLDGLQASEHPGASLGYRALAGEENLADHSSEERLEAVQAIYEAVAADFMRPAQDYHEMGTAVAYQLITPIYNGMPETGHSREHLLLDFRITEGHADQQSWFIPTKDTAESIAETVNEALDYAEKRVYEDPEEDLARLERKAQVYGGLESFLAGEEIGYNQARPSEIRAEAAIAAYNDPRIVIEANPDDYVGNNNGINWNQAFTSEMGYRPESASFRTPEEEKAAAIAGQLLSDNQEQVNFEWAKLQARAGVLPEDQDEGGLLHAWAEGLSDDQKVGEDQRLHAHGEAWAAKRGLEAANYMITLALRRGDPMVLDQTRELADNLNESLAELLQYNGTNTLHDTHFTTAISMTETGLDQTEKFEGAVEERIFHTLQAGSGYEHLEDEGPRNQMIRYAAYQLAGDDLQMAAQHTSDQAMNFNGHVANHALLGFYNSGLSPWSSDIPDKLAAGLTSGDRETAGAAYEPMATLHKDLLDFDATLDDEELSAQDERVRLAYVAMGDALQNNPEAAAIFLQKALGRCEDADPEGENLLVNYARKTLAGSCQEPLDLANNPNHGMRDSEITSLRDNAARDYAYALGILELKGNMTPPP